MSAKIKYLLILFFLHGGMKGETKLIQWGQTTPDPVLLVREIDHYESRLPFDGVVLSAMREDLSDRYGDTMYSGVHQKHWPLSWTIFSMTKADNEDYAYLPPLLKNAKMKKFKHNFMLMTLFVKSSDYVFDWSREDVWERVLHNFKLLCRLSKESGCSGIWFDPEQYAGISYWRYSVLRRNSRVGDFEAWKELLRRRAESMMRVFSEIHPEGEMVLAFGNSGLTGTLGDSDKAVLDRLEKGNYSLLPAFVDGLIAGAGEENKIVDACESSYYTVSSSGFDLWKEKTFKQGRLLSDMPDAYTRKVECSFGIFPTHPRSFKAETPSKNQFTPALLESAVRSAMRSSDRYVWIWNEKSSFWIEEEGYPVPANSFKEHFGKPGTLENAVGPEFRPTPQVYIDAVSAAKAAYLKGLDE